MKNICFLVIMFSIVSTVYSQARQGTVSYQNTQQPAAVIELPFPPDVVNASLNDYLSRKGRSKATDVKGFTTYRNTQPMQGDSTNADLYFKIERKSRQEKQTTLVSLLLTSVSNNSAAAPGINNLNMEQAKVYLDELVPVIEAYSLEQQIKDQNEAVIKAEAKYKSITKTGESLQKKRQSLDKDIEENKQDQQNQKTETDIQNQKLEVLVGKRKS